MAKKKMTDLEKADAYLKAIETYTKRLGKIDSKLEKSNSGRDEFAAADAALKNSKGRKIKKEASLKVEKDQIENNITDLKEGIRIAISKYIADAEEERKKLEANKTRYDKHVEEEKAKEEALKAEIETLERDAKEEDKEIIEDKKAELKDLSSRIKLMEETQASRDEEYNEVVAELNKNKEKYKDYIELSGEELPEPEEIPEEEKPAEKKNEEKKPEEKNTQGKKSETKTTRNNGETKFVYEPVSSEEPKTNSDSSVKEEVNKETDEQAFKRIYGLIKKKEALSVEDADKMYEILSDKDNFKKYKINTDHILPFTKSKAQRIYTSLGKQLDGQIKASLGDKELLEGLNSKDLTRWKDINELGCDNPCNNIVESLEKAIGKEEDEGKKKELETLKGRYEKFVSSAQTMTAVRRTRNELSYKAISESTAEAKTKGMAEELAGGVKTTEDVTREDVARETSVKSSETPKRDVPDKDSGMQDVIE